MKDINKEEFSDFERAWQRAFEQAEMPVEQDVWNNIDGHLANKEADKYKRKIVFYKWVAAASIVFAISISYFSYNFNASQFQVAGNDDALLYNGRTSTSEFEPAEIYAHREKSNIQGGKTNFNIEDLDIQESVPKEDNVLAQIETERNVDQKPLNITSGNDPIQIKEEMAEATLAEGKENEISLKEPKQDNGHSSQLLALSAVPSVEDEQRETALVNDNVETNFAIEQHKGDLVVMHQAKQPYYMEHYAQLLDPPYIYAIPGVGLKTDEKDKAESKVLWAGLNVGSGIFDPNFENGSNYQPKTSPALSQTYANARESPQAASFEESTSAGVSYSLGLNFGMRLNEKWVLQSGVQYAYKSASTNSTTYLRSNYDEKMKPAFTNQMNNEAVNFSSATFTQEYDLLNSFEFATIPIKAGYLLIDRKVGLMLTAGVGADIFLSNTISESNDRLDDVKMSAGSESPFRDLNFNGLLGAELFYQISKQYHLTLEPNYSIALNPLTKSHSSFRSNPQTFGVTAGLKYYWK